MGWGSGINREGREVGYLIEATCDQDGCDEKIDRGLWGCCGGMHDGDEHFCGRYFCGEHIFHRLGVPEQGCEACIERYAAEHPDEIEAAIAEFETRRQRLRDERRGTVAPEDMEFDQSPEQRADTPDSPPLGETRNTTDDPR